MEPGDSITLVMYDTIIYVTMDSNDQFCVGEKLDPDDPEEEGSTFSRHDTLASAMLAGALAVGAIVE